MSEVRLPSSAPAFHPVCLFGRIQNKPCMSNSSENDIDAAFHGKDAKNLAACAKQVVVRSCSDLCQSIKTFCKPAIAKEFWFALQNPKTASTLKLQELYGVVCVLFCSSSDTRFSSSLQRAAGAITRNLYPEVFENERAHVFQESNPGESIFGPSYRMCTWFDGKWRFSAFAVPYMTKACENMGMVPVHARRMVQLENRVTPSPYYKPDPWMLTRTCFNSHPLDPIGDPQKMDEFLERIRKNHDNLALVVEEGASLLARFVDFKNLETSSGETYAEILSSLDATWVSEKMQRQEPFILLERYFGLTHPERPFAVSTNPVVLEDKGDVEQVVAIAKDMGYALDQFVSVTTIPFSFPPALSDCDLALQKAHCRLALGAPDALANTSEAARAVAEEILGESVRDLGDFNHEEFASVVKEASLLVKQALEALREAELSRRRSEAVARNITDMLVTGAWYEIRCRHEWKQVQARVEKWSKENRTTKNKVKRKSKQCDVAGSSRGPDKITVAAAAHQLEVRTKNYTRIAKGVASLVASGIARVLPRHGADAEYQPTELSDTGEVTIEIVPPRSSETPSMHSGTRKLKPLPRQPHQHFMNLLDASVKQDLELALAHREEIELSVAMQMSLATRDRLEATAPATARSSLDVPDIGSNTVLQLLTADDAQASTSLEGPSKPRERRAASAPPRLLRPCSGSDNSDALTSSGCKLSSGSVPTSSSGNVVIYPQGPVSYSNVSCFLENGFLPSLGTLDHDTASPNTCFICRSFLKYGACRDGRACCRCHAPHSLDSLPRGGGRSRQRAARSMAQLRRVKTPDRIFGD